MEEKSKLSQNRRLIRMGRGHSLRIENVPLAQEFSGSLRSVLKDTAKHRVMGRGKVRGRVRK